MKECAGFMPRVLHPQSEGWIGHHCLRRMGQQRQVGRVIANVVEGCGAEPIAQAFQLFRSGKVGSAV